MLRDRPKGILGREKKNFVDKGRGGNDFLGEEGSGQRTVLAGMRARENSFFGGKINMGESALFKPKLFRNTFVFCSTKHIHYNVPKKLNILHGCALLFHLRKHIHHTSRLRTCVRFT